MSTVYKHRDKAQIAALLVGRKVVAVIKDTIALDDGRALRFKGNGGCSGCTAGEYELTELNGVDNIITRVDFIDAPTSAWYEDGFDDDEDGSLAEGGPTAEGGSYKIFVFADNKKVNLATFEGDDGGGYYGTGYTIEVLP